MPFADAELFAGDLDVFFRVDVDQERRRRADARNAELARLNQRTSALVSFELAQRLEACRAECRWRPHAVRAARVHDVCAAAPEAAGEIAQHPWLDEGH